MIFLYLLGEEKAGLLSRFTGLHSRYHSASPAAEW